MLGDHPCRRLEHGRRRVCAADSLAEPRHPEQVVSHCPAGLTEVVEHPRLDLLRRIRREERPHANGEPVLSPELERVLLVRKIAGVDDGGEPDAVRVRVQIGGAAQLLFGCLHGLQRGQRSRGRHHDATLLVHGHAFRDQERSAQAVGDGTGPAASAGNIDRMSGRRRIQVSPSSAASPRRIAYGSSRRCR